MIDYLHIILEGISVTAILYVIFSFLKYERNRITSFHYILEDNSKHIISLATQIEKLLDSERMHNEQIRLMVDNFINISGNVVVAIKDLERRIDKEGQGGVK